MQPSVASILKSSDVRHRHPDAPVQLADDAVERGVNHNTNRPAHRPAGRNEARNA
jgi:hypothetical protein